jgi:uroporphyrinogen-III decarboxylase
VVTPIKQLKTLMAKKSKTHIPKGEIWLGTGLFKQAGLKDTLENHFQMADRLDHAMVCLPVSDPQDPKPDLGYRYFDSTHIKRAAAVYDRPIFAAVDGPFQSLVNQLGLMRVLTDWIQNPKEIFDAYEAESEKALALISKVIEHRVSAVVITDDFSSDSGPFVSPSDIDKMCSPFYAQAVQLIKESGAAVFLHCCGNLSQLIPTIKSWQIDGFAAIQNRANDLERLYHAFDSNIMIMAGIESDLLDTDPLQIPGAAKQHLKHVIETLGATGDLILCSSCGLYKGAYLDQIKTIYSIADSYPHGLRKKI